MEHDLIRRSKLLAKKCMIRGHLDTGSPCPSKVKAVPVDVIEREPAVDVIEREPAVDAVEVVRCGECRRATRGGGGYVWCWSRTMPLDGFCSYGERKEGDEDG